MAFPFTSSIPVFRITFDIPNEVLIFTDLIQTGYSSYGGTANFKGLVQITDPDGTIIYQGTGFSLTAPDFTTPDIDGSTLTWILNNIPASLTSAGLFTPGLYTFDYVCTMNNGTTFVCVQETYEFDYISPAVTIDLSASCRTSELFSSYTAETTVRCGGVDYTPITSTISHHIEKPIGSGANDPGSTTDASRTIGGGNTDATRLWTRVWQTEVSIDVQYNLATWGANTWIIVLDTIAGSDNIDVKCDDSYCNLRLCVENVIALWKAAMGTSMGYSSTTLGTKVLELLAEWTKYEMAERCGSDTTIYITNLETILSSVDCLSNYNVDDASHVVYALGTALGGGGGSCVLPTISYGSTFPTGGIAGSLYIWRDSVTTPTFVKIVYNSGGTWVVVTDILGSAGSAGTNGTNNSSANILYSVLTDVGTAGAGEEILGTYSIPGNTLVSAGDFITLIAVYDLALNDHGKTMKMYFGGDLVATHFTDALIDSSTKTVILMARIRKITANTQKIDSYTEGLQPVTSSAAKDLASIVVVNASAQNSIATVNDVVLKSFTVILDSLLTTIPTNLANWDKGSVSLVADVLTFVTFHITMPSTSYNIKTNAWDVDGNEQFVKIPQSLKTVTGFYALTLVNTTLNWSIEL